MLRGNDRWLRMGVRSEPGQERGCAAHGVTEGSRYFRPELDVLRFMAFLAVFLHHTLPQHASHWRTSGWPPWFAAWAAAGARAGAFGVDLFFVLSAFLITALLLRERDQQGRVAIGSFYARRALRIWPLYYSFLALAIWVVPLVIQGNALRPSYAIAFALLAGNWICVIQGYPLSVAAPLWSVSIEEQFYLVWPVVVSAGGVRGLRLGGTGLLALASATRLWLAYAGIKGTGVWCHTVAHLDPIVVGAVLATYLGDSQPRFRPTVRLGLIVIGLSSWLLAARFGSIVGWSTLWSYPATTLGGAAMLVGSLGLGVGTSVTLEPVIAGLAYLGRISYGLYVFHLLAVTLSTRLQSGRFHLPVAFAITVALAAASYKWLEKPFLRLKSRFTVVPSGHRP